MKNENVVLPSKSKNQMIYLFMLANLTHVAKSGQKIRIASRDVKSFFLPDPLAEGIPRWGAPIARQCPALSCHRAGRRRDDFLRLSRGSVAGYHYVPGRSIICNVMVLQEGLLKSQKLLHQNRRRRRKAKTHVRKHEPLCLRIVWRLCTMTKNSRHTSQHQ